LETNEGGGDFLSPTVARFIVTKEGNITKEEKWKKSSKKKEKEKKEKN